MHGFYRAVEFDPEHTGWDGDRTALGRASSFSRPGRRQTPALSGATIRLSVWGSDGQPLSSATVGIATRTPGEVDANVVYRVWDGGDVHFEPMPLSQDEQMAMWVEADGQRSAEVVTFSNRDSGQRSVTTDRLPWH